MPGRPEDIVLSRHTRGHLARGLGRSYGDAALNGGGRVWDMTGLGGVLDLDAGSGIVRAEAGASLDSLLTLLVPQGWFLPVTPGTRFITVGGALAADVHGKNHHRDGSFSRFVDSFRLLTPDGVVRHVTPGLDLFEATVGGMGLTGIILDATFRLHPIETSTMSVDTVRTDDLDGTLGALAEADRRHRYSVAWVDLLARGRSLGRGVVTSGDHATASGKERRPPRPPRVSVPDIVPGFVLSPWSIRAFNEAWYRRAPRVERSAPRSVASFFYPLDAVAQWNRLYGRRGFLQWQCIVPDDTSLRRILERFAQSGAPSFLVVLKRFGPGRGMLSFPSEGWTLAVDLAVRHRDVAQLLDDLDRLVVSAGGRLYLAKDARASGTLVPDMYPEIDRWRTIQATADPTHQMQSDLDRRLGLTGTRHA